MSNLTDVCDRLTFGLAHDREDVTASSTNSEYFATHDNGCDVVAAPLHGRVHTPVVRVQLRDADKRTVALWTIEPDAVMDMEGDERLCDFLDDLATALDALPTYDADTAPSKVARAFASYCDIVTGYVLDKQTVLDQLTRLADNPQAVAGLDSVKHMEVKDMEDHKVMVQMVNVAGVPEALVISVVAVTDDDGDSFIMSDVMELTPGCMFGNAEPGQFNKAAFQNPTISDVYDYVRWWMRNENVNFGLHGGVTLPKTTKRHVQGRD